jgi:transcriptional regulator with XRE-family HTH domain
MTAPPPPSATPGADEPRDTDAMRLVGHRLQLAMRRRGVAKQMAFAAQLAVDESAISRWQRGANMTLRNAMRLCEALDISLDWLLLGRGSMDGHRGPAAEGTHLRLMEAAAGVPPPVIDAVCDTLEAVRQAIDEKP